MYACAKSPIHSGPPPWGYNFWLGLPLQCPDLGSATLNQIVSKTNWCGENPVSLLCIYFRANIPRAENIPSPHLCLGF